MRSSKHELLARASVFSPTAHPITFTLNQLSNCGKGKAILASHQMYLCGEPICHRVSCALLMVACKLALIIRTTGRALFRPREDFRRVGKKFTGGMAQTLVLFNISLVHFATLLATKIVTSCSKLTSRAMSRSNIRG